MLINAATCPICEHAIQAELTRCPTCGCLVQFTPNSPVFVRANVNESLVQPMLDRCRAQLNQNAQDGIAAYTLGLCYLNYQLSEQGIERQRRSALLLPEKHVILFELAVLLNRPGQYSLALEYATQALRLMPDSRDYRYIHQHLKAATAYARGEVSAAITNWIAAYQEAPQWKLAADALRHFIAIYEAKLTQPIARALLGLSQQDAEHLRILNSNPALQKQNLPHAPKSPGQLGGMSMGLLRQISPTRASAIEQMHTERITAYQQATEAYELQYQTAVAQREATIVQWQTQDQAIRQDPAAMARLCLAVFQEEERRRAEEERRRLEVEQRRLAQQQQRAEAQLRAATSKAPQKKVREKQYLSTKAQYISGLPKGKEKDDISLVVTNLQINVKRGGMLGAWEHTIPMTALVEVSGVTVKHFMSKEKRLQISYRDERGMIAHATFAGLKVDDCVSAMLKARSGK